MMPGIQEAAIEGFERVMAPAEAGTTILGPAGSAPVPTHTAIRSWRENAPKTGA